MDEHRVRKEVKELQKDYRVKWSLDKGYVMITRYGYPKGWSPRTAPLFFSLPYTYPQQPPDVYLPPDMTYNGETVVHQLRPNDDGWRKWCIDRLPWQPDNHTLYTMTQLMHQSLMKPYQNRLIR